MLNRNWKLEQREKEGKIIKTGIVGAGQMGRGMVTQMVLMKGMTPAIVSDIAVIGPEAVYIRCELIHDTSAVREFIRAKVDDKYIPDLFILDHATEYMFYGAQMMASER